MQSERRNDNNERSWMTPFFDYLRVIVLSNLRNRLPPLPTALKTETQAFPSVMKDLLLLGVGGINIFLFSYRGMKRSKFPNCYSYSVLKLRKFFSLQIVQIYYLSLVFLSKQTNINDITSKNNFMRKKKLETIFNQY